ncbi:hypothetical protein CLV42_107253 [Chitinophaga ginsengisoli]|uniref:Uncharacterized protein n=1 Tax=Chitinophaga ginsengisoli TaxID=363837 RepID=A0A2P8G582_9BACT|nr:hypothetical protein CLV42_107253 [Chitinophaga ginsengisoli]
MPFLFRIINLWALLLLTVTMNFYFRPLYKNATYLADLNSASIPDFGKESTLLKIKHVSIRPVYHIALRFNGLFAPSLWRIK